MDASGRRRVKLNVGGRVFETYLSTLSAAGEKSLLASSAEAALAGGDELYFDSDPDVFAVLLSVLRTGRLAPGFSDKEALLEEASFYGVTEAVKAALAPPPLDGVDVQRVGSVLANGRDFPSAIASAEDGSLWVGHGSKITVFDWALQKRGTTLTEFSTIQSLCRISESCIAAGATDFPGLHFYDVGKSRRHEKSLVWSDQDDPRIYSPTVQAIASSDDTVFASFLSGHKMDNTILVVDKSRLEIVKELARQSGTSAGHSKHATKLQWLPGSRLLAACGVHGGAFGYSSYIRLWDVRSDRVALDWTEPNVRNARPVERDSFSDVAVSEELSSIVKVSVVSGAIAMADLRKLGGSDNGVAWVTLVESNPSLEMGLASPQNMLLCYNRQVYCSRGSDVEVWAELRLGGDEDKKETEEDWYAEDSFRRNFLEHSRRHSPGHDVTHMEAGGNRLFISRNGLQGVEVWESR